MQYTPLIWPLVFAVVINSGLAIYALRYRSKPAALSFSILMWLGALIAFIYALELSAASFQLRVSISQFRFSAAFLAPMVLTLTINYLDLGYWLTRKRLILLFMIPVITVLLSLTSSYHHLFRYDFQELVGPVTLIVFKRGIWWDIYYFYTASTIAVACTLLIWSFPSRPTAFRNSFIFLVAILFVMLVDILYTLNITPIRGYYWTPTATSIAGLLFGWVVLYGRMFDFMPVARNTVIENIDDLVIVLDLEEHIADFNRAAQVACSLSQADIGLQPKKALSPELAEILGEKNITRQEVRLSLPENTGSGTQQRVYELTRSSIRDNGQRKLGYLYLLHDISEAKRLEQALRQAHDELEQRVQERTSELSLANSALQQEVSQRKEAEETLFKRERELVEALEFNKSILNTSSIGILTYNESGQCIFANQAAAKIVGTDIAGLLQQNFHQIHSWYVNGVLTAALKALSSGEEQPLEAHSITTSERDIWTSFSFSSFYDRGEKHLLVFVQDITERKRAEEALYASEAEYRQLVETANEGIVILDAQHKVTYINRQVTQMTGYQPEQAIGQPGTGFIFPEDLAEQEKILDERMQGLTGRYERKFRHAAGHAIWLAISSSPLTGKDGQIVGSFSMLSDITERKLAEDALRESEHRYQALVRSSFHHLFMLNPEGVYVESNDRVSDFGLEKGEALIGSSLNDVYPTEVVNVYIRQLERVLATGQAVEFEHSLTTATGEFEYIVTLYPIYRYGEIEAVGGISRDISDSKRAEKALHQANGYNRSLIEASLDPLVTIGPDGKITDVNSATEQVTGFDRRVLIGTDFTDYFTDPKKARSSYRKVYRVGVVRDYELELKHRDGRRTPVLYNATVYRDETGKVSGVVTAARDITRRKQIEAAERDQRRLAETLRDTAAALSRSLSLDQVLDQILANVGRLVPSESVEILLVENREPGNTLVRVAREYGPSPVEPGRSMLEVTFILEQTANLRWMGDNKKPLVIPDTRTYPGWITVPHGVWIRSQVAAPVHIKGELAGFIDLYSATPGFFSDADAKRLEAFASQAAIAIENARLYAEVQAANERLQALSLRLVQVQESERRHLARELHDEIGQALTGLKLSLEIGTGQLTSTDPAAKTQDLASLQQHNGSDLQARLSLALSQVSELIARTRELSLALRPAMLDDLGLLPALIWHLDRYHEQTGIRVSFQASDLEGRRFPAEVETAAYRIVQEALTNVARYARIEQAAVQIWVESSCLYVGIEDRGNGFDLQAVLSSGKAGGLAGMQERVSLLDGQLTIESIPGYGTRLTAVLPI